MKKSNTLFDCSQKVLYLVCIAGWNLCTKFLTSFAAFRAIYTPAYIADKIQAVKDANNLQPETTDTGDRTISRIECVSALKVVRRDWQKLKTYISNAFPEDQVKAQLKIAGSGLYRKVSAKNWSSAHSLIDDANSFIENNLATLTANGTNMPADFQATFESDGAAFVKISAAYFDATVEKKQFTAKKQNALNACYESLIIMLKDGQQIFAEDKVAKEQFVFAQLKGDYKGGSASLIGYITNQNTQPVEGAVITSQNGAYTATTNKKGYYRITRIAEGTYNFTISCPGYAAVEQPVTFTAGMRSKADILLVNAMKKAS